jgi:hypothetical protein
MHNEAPQPKMEPAAQPPRGPPFSSFGGGVPIAQAPVQQQPLVQSQQPMAMSQHPVAQPVQAMSPGPRPLQAPVQQFRLGEREPAARVPLPQKASSRPPVAEPREQRPLAAAQPLQPSRSEAAMRWNIMPRWNVKRWRCRCENKNSAN